MKPPKRKIEIAKLCKLVTGSYEGKSMDCPCDHLSQCQLTENERRVLIDHPDVAQRHSDCFAEYIELPSSRIGGPE